MMVRIVQVLTMSCLLVGLSYGSGLNVGASAVGGIFDLFGLDDAQGPKIVPSEGGMGGAISVDAMFPLVSDLSLHVGAALEFRDFRGHQTISMSLDCEGCKNETWDDDVVLDLLYLEIPVYFRTNASPTVVIEGGPVIGFNVLSKYYGPFNSDWADLEETSLFEFGFTAGLALQMTDNLEMSLRASYIITDMMDDDELDYKLPSQTFKFMGGFTYWFGGGLEPPKTQEEPSPDKNVL